MSKLFAVVVAIACSSGAGPRTTASRSYRLGFSALPPRLTTASVLATVEAWRTHADVALMSLTPPWKSLLADTSAALLVRRDVAPLAGLYRSRGLPVIVEIDATDGLARDKEAPELVALGRSIAEPAVQSYYREYLLAVDSIVHPEYLGLAMETNLIRAIAPQPLYAALRVMVNDGATALSAQHSTARRFVSVQVETAWGRLPAASGFVGIETDRAEFPFIEAIGLSSYPYLGGFAQPEDIPLDYYSRLIPPGTPPLPMLVVEGGWPSANAGGIPSSPDEQARYIRRQMAIADSARLIAVTQITFTDIDLSSIPIPEGSILPAFAFNGLVDVDLHPKPALAEWDRAMARPLRAP